MPVGTLDYKGNSEKVSRSDMQFCLVQLGFILMSCLSNHYGNHFKYK